MPLVAFFDLDLAWATILSTRKVKLRYSISGSLPYLPGLTDGIPHERTVRQGKTSQRTDLAWLTKTVVCSVTREYLEAFSIYTLEGKKISINLCLEQGLISYLVKKFTYGVRHGTTGSHF